MNVSQIFLYYFQFRLNLSEKYAINNEYPALQDSMKDV